MLRFFASNYVGCEIFWIFTHNYDIPEGWKNEATPADGAAVVLGSAVATPRAALQMMSGASAAGEPMLTSRVVAGNSNLGSPRAAAITEMDQISSAL